ncbi:MAG: hypothetical protein FWE65_00990 [Eggerthellaceae bacterium]|nr:hypothetical protein [Eggerthellaceae bacterium]
MRKRTTIGIISLPLVILIALFLSACDVVTQIPAPPLEQQGNFIIANPYANVDWEEYGQYKANFHAHTTNSDGKNTLAEMVEDHYAKGYSILAVTDHNFLTADWCSALDGPNYKRLTEIEAGLGRGGAAMIAISNCIEQSATEHVNSFFAAYTNPADEAWTMADTIAAVEALGGISHINHPGRYTGGVLGGDEGAQASNDPYNVDKYVALFLAYPSLVGMEIVNKDDNESRSDKILWDNILAQLVPEGRFVWGFANDDTHSIEATGLSWNVMLLPELSQAATRDAMIGGEFYAVSRFDRRENISAEDFTLAAPSIVRIVVESDSITIVGADYENIEWIAGGKKIATGATLELNEHEAEIGSYVRAQLKSDNGIAYTQPFGISKR